MAKIDIRRLDKYMDEYPKRKKMVRQKIEVKESSVYLYIWLERIKKKH
mgnify:CR=1 FL=1